MVAKERSFIAAFHKRWQSVMISFPAGWPFLFQHCIPTQWGLVQLKNVVEAIMCSRLSLSYGLWSVPFVQSARKRWKF